ncbi:MAG: methyl-accepting chemotaxis protein [Rhodospirillum sp.]|nr:methyl-accepting chemotaxis protein [Rhodospirillum sp.]
MPLKYKISLCFSVVVMFAVAMGGTVYLEVKAIRNATAWNEHTHAVLGSLGEMIKGMVNQETGVRGYLVSSDESFLEPFTSGKAQFDKALSQVRSLTSDNSAQQARLDIAEGWARTWRTEVAEPEIAFMQSAETEQKARDMEASGAGKKAMDSLRTAVSELRKEEEKLLSERSAMQEESISNAIFVAIGGAASAIAASIVLGFLLDRVTGGPITRMTQVMSRLAGGDLTVSILDGERKDEIGAMAGAVQVFKDNAIQIERLRQDQAAAAERSAAERKQSMLQVARTFEERVLGVVDGVANSATEMEVMAQTMSAAAQQSQAQASSISAAADQASANVQAVASASEELSQSIVEIGEQVTMAARISEEASGVANRSTVIVNGLAAAADNIDSVVNLITNIASQTNLLALNATIEAARAGDAGKGFAVVAGEVKNLANQTARATDEIRSQILAVQTETHQAVEAIGTIGEIISRIREISAMIASSVEEQGAATGEIARNIQQAAEGTQDVTENIGGVAEAVEATGSAGLNVLSASRTLGTQASQMKTEVTEFLRRITA